MMDILKLVISIVICEFAGIIGSFFTMKSIPNWYKKIKKPSFNPPNWIFGPVWTLLYFLMGISLYLIWNSNKNLDISLAVIIFSIQLILNIAWSMIFFKLKSPKYAFIEIIFLFISILATIIIFYQISRIASYMLIPYILWVSFASILNFYVWILNK
jgi:translocator protein